jgi:hypothetical protein
LRIAVFKLFNYLGGDAGILLQTGGRASWISICSTGVGLKHRKSRIFSELPASAQLFYNSVLIEFIAALREITKSR